MDIDAERERIRQEIEELERSLGPRVPSVEVEVSGSSLESGSDDDDDEDGLEDDSDSDIRVEMEVDPAGGSGADEHVEGDADLRLPQTPETCLQMNLVYQEVIQEKLEELHLLLAQNKEQQEKLTWQLAGKQGTKSSDGKTVPANMFLGHFMKPYFKDKVSGVGPPANADTREKTTQGIKSFEELVTVKWKSREKLLLWQSVVSDHLQRLLQPKLLKLDYLSGKQAKAKDDVDRQILAKQIQETEREISDINQLPEETLLGNRSDEHDWDKIANINFEGTRNATELRKYWQNSEHPSISKKEWSQEEIGRLQEVAARHNLVDWQAIAQELGSQRSPFQCLQKFQACNKDFKRCEWTPEEDQMLFQLVQEMRVGEHIPYRKIAYYMEGRDSAQLIYRWTKRVDPNVKRGAWTPEEDALLLKAVAKYRERDWYKIRAEVPGRSDNQCRDRYLNSLHYDIKKGKWSQEEERSLIELTEKYGVGHWAQIASQLPHRSGAQCLSKWKVLLGYRRNGRRKRESRPGPRERPSSSSEGSDLDLGEASEEEEEKAPKTPRSAREAGQWQVPQIDLWIPTRKELPAVRGEELAAVTLLSKGFDESRGRRAGPSAAVGSGGRRGAGGLAASKLGTSQLGPAGSQEELRLGSRKNSGSTKDSWRVSLAYVKSVLRRNCYEQQRRNREISRKKRFASLSRGRVLGPPARETHRGQRGGLWRTTLYRRLMMAVTPWAGPLVQDWALRVKAEASRKSKVEFIAKQLQGVRLASTPLFTLFIQLLRIDVDGCMTVIRKRKRQLELLEAVVGRTEQASPAQEPAGQTPSLPPGKKLVPLKAKEGPGVPACPWRALLPPRPPPKPKTVSELLREKRLREAKTRRLEQRRLLLAPRLLLPPTVLLQQAPASACQALGQPGPPSSAQAGPLLPPAPAPAPPLPSAGSSGASLQGSAGASREPGLGGGSPERSREAPEVAGCPPPALPPPGAAAPPPWPAPSGGSTLVAPSPVPAFCPQQSPVTLLPTLLAPRPAAPKQVLPLTWLLTPQGFVPLALVGLPQQGEPPSAPAAEARGVVAAGAGSGTPPPGAQAPWASAGSPQQGGASRPPDPSPAPAATAQPPSAASPHPAPGPAQPPASTGPLPQPHGARPAQPQEEAAAAPDYSLVSLEGGAAVREWAQGGPKVSSPPGDASLPYLPPSLCSLRTLAALLRSKGALERSAAALALPGEEPGQPRLDTLRAAVRQRLSANPAYQLLRARFLAALTFPAALAALAPSRVPTTLRGGRQGVDSSDDSGLEEEEEEEEEEEGGGSGETTAGGGAGRAPGHEEAAAAGRRQEEPSSDSADSDHRSKPSVRRSSRLQKRRRRRW